MTGRALQRASGTCNEKFDMLFLHVAEENEVLYEI
jgi:hypothetical protein